MCNNEHNASNDCIEEILAVILVLQENADCGSSCLATCDRKYLGCGTTSISCNTRPIVCYNCNGEAYRFPLNRDATTEENTTEVFRLEKMDCNCITVRALNPVVDETTQVLSFEPTNTFATIKISCICALRCLNDTYVECI